MEVAETKLFKELDILMKIPYESNFVVDIGCSYNSHFLRYTNPGIIFDLDANKIKRSPKYLIYDNIQLWVFHNLNAILRKITPDNVVNTLNEFNTPKKFFALNLDVDSYDLFILINILKEFEPKIIIAEINEIIPLGVYFSVIYDDKIKWQVDNFFGFSLQCLEPILKRFGYYIHCVAYNNVILIKGLKETNLKTQYNDGYINAKDRHPTFYYNDPFDYWQDLSNTEIEKTLRNHYKKYDGNYVIGEECLNLISKLIA